MAAQLYRSTTHSTQSAKYIHWWFYTSEAVSESSFFHFFGDVFLQRACFNCTRYACYTRMFQSPPSAASLLPPHPLVYVASRPRHQRSQYRITIPQHPTPYREGNGGCGGNGERSREKEWEEMAGEESGHGKRRHGKRRKRSRRRCEARSTGRGKRRTG